ncbi:MAG: type VI secretion system tip protein VgrG [Myxococcales bacterium]|nr:type VI secretion system tip protein VgrG [Myxococcales bacterium]MCB9523620.1 type VI secretion system tip protein VgrG [Myxococcales bacterium]
MSKNFTQQNVGLSVTAPVGEDVLILQTLNGEDRISGLFLYQLEMISEDPEVDMDAMVGESVTAKLAHGDNEFCFNGVCARFVQAGTNERFTTYFAELRPWLWELTLTSDSRIFQEMSAVDIIKQVFDEGGYSDYRVDATGGTATRVYTVQYQETDFNFVTRLMEDEGICYFFEHEEGKHTLVLADAPDHFQPREGVETAPVKGQDNTAKGDEIVYRMALEQQVIVGGYAMADYNFEKPSTALDANVSGEDAAKEVFEYPGGYMVKGDGDSRSKLRIEAAEAPKVLVKGQSYIRGFISGAKVEFTDHVRADLNGEYVMKWVSHQATTTRYQNTFECFPADIPFRPPRVTRRPVIHGQQSAMVTGKSGEEIYTDKYGRIKVHFYWDRESKKDENTTCWIRVAQGWAGKGWGMWFLPRIGQEVLVSFLDGDPDRPIVTGSVYNAEQTVPYSLPGDMTKSTIKSDSSKGSDGFNEIRFEDKKGEEEIYIFAEKDMNVLIDNDSTRTVMNDETVTVEMNRTTIVKQENETHTIEKGDRAFEISKGKETYKVKATRDVKVDDNETHENGADFTHKVKGNYKLSVGGNLTIEVKGKISIVSTGEFKAESKQGMDLKAAMDLKMKAGMNWKAEGGINAEVKGGVAFKAKGGAMAEVVGGGMLTLKGGIVKIN